MVITVLQWFNFCWYFLLGVSTALDTVGSQAHGEGNPNAVVACCVSAVTVLSLLCIPVVIALLTADVVAETIFFQTPESGKASLPLLSCSFIITSHISMHQQILSRMSQDNKRHIGSACR